MAELDPGYKSLISVILNLDHDRYKSYFNYFIVLHLGLITAIGGDFASKLNNLRPFFVITGIVLAVAWLMVQYKIQRDIREAWKAIEAYENSDKYDGVIKVHQARWKGFPASKLMLVIPCCFLFAYLFILIKI